MPLIIPVTASSDKLDVGVASAQFATLNALANGRIYRFICTVACWIKQAANPTASAAAGNMYVGANEVVLIDGALGAKLAVIRASGDGVATLTPVKLF